MDLGQSCVMVLSGGMPLGFGLIGILIRMAACKVLLSQNGALVI
jgi:hypothetical protein